MIINQLLNKELRLLIKEPIFETMEFKKVIKPFTNIWQVIGAMTLMNLTFLFIFWRAAFSSWESFGISLIWGTTVWVTQAVGNSAVFHYLDLKLPWRNGMLKRAIANIIGVGTYSATAYLIVQFIMFSIFYSDTSITEIWNQSIQSTPITVTISFSISFLLTLIGFGKAMIETEVEKEKLQTEMMRYKYESLRNQINPHFLFNSFNVLSELVYEDQKLAVKFIHQLSDLYRYVLDVKDKELIPLKDELKFIDAFSFLLKIRFENRVEFHIEVNHTEDEFIVPMALQLLIENCIKHNEATSNNPLIIRVTREVDCIKVSNNLQPKQTEESSTKIGLHNLKERYAFFDTKEIIVKETENEYSVCIPILKVSDK